MDNVKPWWKSRTLWFNVVAAIVLALEDGIGIIQPFVPGNVYAWASLVIAVGNAALRVVTRQGLRK